MIESSPELNSACDIYHGRAVAPRSRCGLCLTTASWFIRLKLIFKPKIPQSDRGFCVETLMFPVTPLFLLLGVAARGGVLGAPATAGENVDSCASISGSLVESSSRMSSGKVVILSGSSAPSRVSTVPMSRFPWIITTFPLEPQVLRL